MSDQDAWLANPTGAGRNIPTADSPTTDRPTTDRPTTDTPSKDRPTTDSPPTVASATDTPATPPASDTPGSDASPSDARATATSPGPLTLEQRWQRLGGPTSSTAFVDAGRELIAHYDEAWRGYHNRRHIEEALDALSLIGGGLPEQVAIWFHDAVYGLGPGADEHASADLAVAVLSGLGMAASLVRQVERLVLLTEHHAPASGDLPGARVSDADMAILAASPERYAESVRGIRQEYARFSDEEFTAGRIQVLESFLALPAIYHTAHGRRHWEPAARRNISLELEQRRSRA